MASIDTNLSTSPYLDTYDETKLYQQVLFKPGVTVQVRELNELQSMLAKQIERFGSAIYQSGTIVNGCNFSFLNPYPYIKIQDSDLNGNSAIVAQYPGLFITNASGLKAFILNSQDGFEATAPDLKTLYVQYINSGNTGNLTSFSPGDTLTVTNSNNSIFSVKVNNGGIAFSNTDKLVVVPAVVVNVASGSFTNGEYITQPDISSNLQIISIDSLSLATKGQVILSLRPRLADLSNTQVLPAAWSTANNATIRNVSNTVTGTVMSVLGTGTTGGVVTDSTGKITQIIVTYNGYGYTNLPYAGVRSGNNATGIGTLSLTAQNYVAQVKVANTSSPVGNGYAFSVSDGVIYQKGYFLRVPAQSVIVSKYSQSPNNIAVGFNSVETIINSNIDASLLDNASGQDNAFAPGADRLQITPTLTAIDKSLLSPSNSFFTIVAWSDGNPYKQNQVSSYSAIGDEMARRTVDEAGDYVVDAFELTTQSPADPTLEGNTFNVVVDPGSAYISGYHVQTTRNYVMSVKKGTDTLVVNNQTVGLNFGNYIRVKNVAGTFQYSTGDLIDLRDTAANALATHPVSLTAAGVSLGSARIRSMVYESGVQGTSNCVYRLYLFNIQINSGKRFADVRSMFYNGTRKGIADIVVELDPTTSANVAILHSTSGATGLLYPLGVSSIKNVNNATYTFRTVYQDAQISNTGIMTYSLAGHPNQNFPFLGVQLPDTEARKIYLAPVSRIVESATRAGTVSTTATSANLVGSGTAFITDFVPGDGVYISGNTTQNVAASVVTVVNNTFMTLDTAVPFTNTAANTQFCFHANVPVALGNRPGFTANTDLAGDLLTIDLGRPFLGGNVNATLGVDIQRTGVGVTNKNASRDRFVALNLANSVYGTSGPWCLGIPDAFRLKAVYLGSNSSVNTSSTNVTSDFYLDIRQNIDFLDLSFLVQSQASSLTLSSSNWLLVQFDHFTAFGSGFFATPSYVSANAAQVANVDSLPLANLDIAINTMEIPQVYTNQGGTLDLLNCLDFRPTPSNTVISSNNYATAPVNPVYSLSFGNTADPTTDRQFPNPNSLITLNVEQYLGRVDSVFAGKDGSIFVLHGAPTNNPLTTNVSPNQPRDSMLLQTLSIPAYPTIPFYPSATLTSILNMGRGSQNLETGRFAKWMVKSLLSSSDISQDQPMGYSMRDIGSIDRRVAALEYYQSLSLLETDMVSKIIPSGVDPTTNRFKFGFFVDDYSTGLYQQSSDPQYKASIENACLVPNKTQWTVGHSTGDTQTCPYIDQVVVEQNYATGAQPDTNCYVITNTSISNVQNYYFHKKTSAVADDYFSFILPTGTISCKLFFWSQRHGSAITVYQGNTRLTGGLSAVQLSASDITLLQANTFPEQWFSASDFPPDTASVSGTGDDTWRSGSISWNHDASRGSGYAVQFHPGSSYSDWRYAIQYTVPVTSVQKVPCPVAPVVINPPPPVVDIFPTGNSTPLHLLGPTTDVAPQVAGPTTDVAPQVAGPPVVGITPTVIGPSIIGTTPTVYGGTSLGALNTSYTPLGGSGGGGGDSGSSGGGSGGSSGGGKPPTYTGHLSYTGGIVVDVVTNATTTSNTHYVTSRVASSYSYTPSSGHNVGTTSTQYSGGGGGDGGRVVYTTVQTPVTTTSTVYNNTETSSGDITMTATGLRPNTVHTLTFDRTFTKSIRPIGGKVGDPLVTGPDGTLNFKLHFGDSSSKNIFGIGVNATGVNPQVTGNGGTVHAYLADARGDSNAQTTIKWAFTPGSQPKGNYLSLTVNNTTSGS